MSAITLISLSGISECPQRVLYMTTVSTTFLIMKQNGRLRTRHCFNNVSVICPDSSDEIQIQRPLRDGRCVWFNPRYQSPHAVTFQMVYTAVAVNSSQLRLMLALMCSPHSELLRSCPLMRMTGLPLPDSTSSTGRGSCSSAITVSSM